jgi:hypothetical protein
MKTVAEVIGVSRSNLVERYSSVRRGGSVGRHYRTRSSWHRSGGNRRIADLRLPARSRHPQAPGAGRGLKAA